ncbi:MBL fold metallo-hydrolase [Pokkaliibacter sp. CJK22405]|uniref:MBL fold metallo-hydrolase n=1 Tax=Pokkaliibacter sp. CJK22405 TaxID=3384615 RepID=UPI0039853F09
MELLFLGTSAAIPTRRRNVSATAIRIEGNPAWHLVDCGEGTQHRLIGSGLTLSRLDTLFISHVHGDHCFGLPGLLATASMQGRKTPLRLVAPAAIQSILEVMLPATQTTLGFELDFIALETLTQPLSIADFEVEVTLLEHRTDSYAFAFSEKRLEGQLDTARLKREGVPAGPLWGQLARAETVEFAGKRLDGRDYIITGRAPRKAILCGDNGNPECLTPLMPNTHLVMHEATFLQAHLDAVGNQHGHSSAQLIARFCQKHQLPHLVLNHFSARYHSAEGMTALQSEAQSVYEGSLVLANDLHRVVLNKHFELEQYAPQEDH